MNSNSRLLNILAAIIYSGRVRSQYLVNFDNARPGIGHRRTSANASTSNAGGMKRFLATSAMTEGKPGPDGHILHFDWDEADKNGAQLYLPGSSDGTPAYRSQSTSADWSGTSWNTFVTSKDFINNKNTSTSANNVNVNGITYYSSNGPSTSLGASSSDGALINQYYNMNWQAQIAVDYRNGRLFSRGKNSGTWQDWVTYDPIVEQGTSGIWTYRKYQSGIAECWGTATISSVPQYGTFAGWYAYYRQGFNSSSSSDYVAALAYPFTFTAIDYYNFGCKTGNSHAIPSATAYPIEMKGAAIRVLSSASTSTTIEAKILVIGKWK